MISQPQGAGRTSTYSVGAAVGLSALEGKTLDIEEHLNLPDSIKADMWLEADRQDDERGDWANPRGAEMPLPPWPNEDSPIVKYLLAMGGAYLTAGLDIDTVLVWVIVHSWYEGGIENYDRGQRDARQVS